MARPLRIGLYSQFFGATLGGGEKYFGVTAEAVRDAFPGHRVEILSAIPVDVPRYERELNLDLHGIEVTSTNARVTPLHRTARGLLGRMPLYRDLLLSLQAMRHTRRYDLFIAMVYVTPVFSRAARTVMLCQFPYERGPIRWRRGGLVRSLYRLPWRAVRRLAIGDEIASLDAVICQSEYVRRWVREYWGLDPRVVNPPIDIPPEEPDFGAKRRVILSVGRFFATGHTKRHDLMVEEFRRLVDGGLEGWELHLAGSVHHEGPDAGYFERIVEMARGYPVHVHGDIAYGDLRRLYREAAIYWHASGFGVDERENPANIEHFGMTTAEAMACGAVPVVIRAGGQPEVVEDGVSGYTWATTAQLRERTLELAAEPELRERMGRAARERSRLFSREHFRSRVAEELAPLVAELEAGR